MPASLHRGPGRAPRAGPGAHGGHPLGARRLDWQSGHSVLVTGPTGACKSWLACALAQYACRRGHSALYQRVPRLGEKLRIRHGNGTFGKWLLQLAKTDVLLLNDWGMTGLDTQTLADLLEIINDPGPPAKRLFNHQPITHCALACLGGRCHDYQCYFGPRDAAKPPFHFDG